MKSLVIVALLLAFFAGCNCANEEEEFIESCKLESKTWNMFVNYLGSKDIRDKYFNDWYYTRAKRRVRGGRVNKDKCPDEVDGEKLVSLEDPEVLEYMCSEEKSFEDSLKTCTNDLIRKKLKYELSMSRNRSDRLDLRYFCTDSVQRWDPSEELANKLMLTFKDACAKDAVYDFISGHYSKIWRKYSFAWINSLRLAGFDHTNAMKVWTDFCDGSLEECCGNQINLEQARRDGHLNAAQVFIKIANEMGLERNKKSEKKILEETKKIFQKELDKQKKDKSESTQKALKLISDKLASLE